MSVPLTSSSGYAPSHSRSLPFAMGLSWIEKAVLFGGIVEIPLQIDKYYMLQEEDSLLGSIGGLNLSVTTLALIVLYAIWFADLCLHRRTTNDKLTFGIPMLIYLAINLLSFLVASKPILSFFDFAIIAQAYLLFFYIANRIETYSDVLFLLVTFALTILAECSTFFYAAAVGLLDDAIFIGPIKIAVDSTGRHCGTLHSPNLAGCTLALIWIPIAASLLFVRDKLSWRMILAATIAGFLAILMTQSRGAILSFVIGAAIIGAGMLSRNWLPSWTVLVAVLLAILSIYPLLQLYEKRIQHGDGESAASRKHLSLIAFEMIAERPLTGYGSGNCHLAGERFATQPQYRAEWYYTIHCKYLLVWVETGIFGLLAFLCVLGNGFRQAVAVWLLRTPALSGLGLAIAAALIGHSIHMLVDIFNSRSIVQMLWILLGLSAAIYRMSIQIPRESQRGVECR